MNKDYTLEQLRELPDRLRQGEPLGLCNTIALIDGYVATLEELARMKEPVKEGEVAAAIAAIGACLCGEFLRTGNAAEVNAKFGPCEPECACVGLMAARSTIESLAAQLAAAQRPCDGSCDIALARRQVGPDAIVPGSAKECAELWERESRRLSAQLAARDAEIARLKSYWFTDADPKETEYAKEFLRPEDSAAYPKGE